MSFLEIPYSDLVKYLYQRECQLADFWEHPRKPKVIIADGLFEDKLQKLLPLTRSHNRKIISATQSPWCLYTTNGALWPDVHAQPPYIADILGIRMISVVMVEHIPQKQLGSMQFIYADGTKAKWIPSDDDPESGHFDTPGRSITVHYESRWEFKTRGDPLPCEEIERYTAKRIKERLTPFMIGDYCQYFGIDLFNPDFYKGEAIILDGYIHPDTEKIIFLSE